MSTAANKYVPELVPRTAAVEALLPMQLEAHEEAPSRTCTASARAATRVVRLHL